MHKIHVRTNGRRVGSGPAASAGRGACPRPHEIMIALFYLFFMPLWISYAAPESAAFS
jgi:hypothetical protein